MRDNEKGAEHLTIQKGKISNISVLEYVHVSIR